MMNLGEMLAELRRLIGNPSHQDCNDPELTRYFNPALERLAAKLEFNIQTAAVVALVADTGEYQVPSDCAYVLWVEWDGRRLTPSSMARWIRESRDWRGAASGPFGEYVLQGRSLFLNAPPSNTEITTDGFLTVCYIGTSPGVSAVGVPLLTDAELWPAIYDAAADYLGLNPGRTPEEIAANRSRLESNRVNQAIHERDAVSRSKNRVRPYNKRLRLPATARVPR